MDDERCQLRPYVLLGEVWPKCWATPTRRAYAPKSNTSRHFYNEKSDSRGFHEHWAPLGGPSNRRSTAISSLLITFERTGNAKTVFKI